MLKPLILGIGIITAGLLGADDTARGAKQDDPPAQRGLKGRRLLPKVDTLRLRYIAWGCYCPPWATLTDMQRYHDEKLARHTIFIEPATPALELPDHYTPSRYYVRVIGQFYAHRYYPEDMPAYEAGRRARMFRYTSYELEEMNPFLPKDDTTLVVYYDAISCACPHWATRIDRDDPSNRGHIYLEPATPQLPVADKLWDGRHLPLRLLVTGQYVTRAGLPKGYVMAKGQPESAPVFRYRRFKVLPNQRKAGVRKR